MDWWQKDLKDTSQQLNLNAAATEARLEPRACALQQEKSLQWEACALKQIVAPLSTTRERPKQQWRPSKTNQPAKQTNHAMLFSGQVLARQMSFGLLRQY